MLDVFSAATPSHQLCQYQYQLRQYIINLSSHNDMDVIWMCLEYQLSSIN